MAQANSDIIAAHSKINESAAENVETDGKDVLQVDPPLVIINKIVENPELVKAHAYQPGSYSLSDVKSFKRSTYS